MLEWIFGVLAGCIVLAVLCALFGTDKHSLRDQAVLRELLSVFPRRSASGDHHDAAPR
jgi:hypothetical protein